MAIPFSRDLPILEPGSPALQVDSLLYEPLSFFSYPTHKLLTKPVQQTSRYIQNTTLLTFLPPATTLVQAITLSS